MNRRLLFYFVCCLCVLMITLANCSKSDRKAKQTGEESVEKTDEEKAEEIYAEACRIIARADKTEEPEKRLKLYRDGLEKLEKVISRYPETRLAKRLKAGVILIEGITLSEIRETIIPNLQDMVAPEVGDVSEHDIETVNEARRSGAREAELERYDIAIRKYKQALEKVPEDAYLHNDLGTVYYKLGLQSMDSPMEEGEFDSREIDVRELSDSQAFMEIRNAIAESVIIIAKVGTDGAKSEIVKYAQSSGHYAHSEEEEAEYGLSNYFRVTIITGKTKEMFLKAEQEYLKAIEIMCDYSAAYRNLGTLYFRMGRNEDAVDHWRRALQIEPTDEELERLLDAYE